VQLLGLCQSLLLVMICRIRASWFVATMAAIRASNLLKLKLRCNSTADFGVVKVLTQTMIVIVVLRLGSLSHHNILRR